MEQLHVLLSKSATAVVAIIFICSQLSLRGQTPVSEIPFDFYHDEIVLHVTINGQGPFVMLLDTDTDPSSIDLGKARILGLKLDPVPGQATGGGSDKNAVYLTILPAIDVNGFTAAHIDTLALDLSKLSQRLGRPLDGILGNSFLSGRIVQIDYAKQLVRFFDASPGQITNRENTNRHVVVPFRYDDDDGSLIIDDVQVNGKNVRAAIDTGSNGTFSLTPAATKDLGLEEQATKGKPASSVGYNGKAQNTRGHLNRITIATLTVDSPDVVFFGTNTGRDHKPWGLNIGNAFLKGFLVTIDYPKKLIAFDKL